MDKQQELRARERATYRYLQALDAGDIATIIEVLQQALYDAPLEEMILESHQAYFQSEQTEQRAREKAEAPGAFPSFAPSMVRQIGQQTEHGTRSRHQARWAQMLVAILVIVALIGGFISLQAIRSVGSASKHRFIQQSSTTCLPYALKPFGTLNHSQTRDNLLSVIALSENDAWAVGESLLSGQADSTRYTPLIEHWNGHDWSAEPVEPLGRSYGVLNAVSAISVNDIWAVGFSYLDPASPSSRSNERTLVEHWDGTKWSTVSSLNGPGGDGAFTAVSAVSSHDVWAVGTTSAATPLIEHWDGTRWQVMSVEAKVHMMLYGVTAVATKNVWITGAILVNGQYHAVVRHWNGTTWQTLPTLPAYSVFYTMNLLSANDIWASGEVDQANKSAIAIEHWDGHRWTQFSLPTAYGSMAMTALTDQNIWGVGDPVGNPQADQLLHWDGKAWHRTSIPVIGSGASIAVSGQQLWIVSGDPISTNQDGSALILGQRTCA